MNAIGNLSEGLFQPSSDPNNDQGFYINMAGKAVGISNVVHIPIFQGNVFESRIDMFLEMLDLSHEWTSFAVEEIGSYLADNPLEPNERLILLGESGGGTIAIEMLSQLAEDGISVDQVIMRGSPLLELFGNVERIDYITSRFDYYDSLLIDMNPSDDSAIYRHRMDFIGHVPPDTQMVAQIGLLIYDLILEGASQ